MRTLNWLLAALTAAAMLHPTSAAAQTAPVQMQVVDRETGLTLPDYAYRGERWIAGTPGHRYAVRIRNLGAQRVLAVLSVDGVNAITGESAATSQSGYVLAPYESAEITGWRKSMSDVAAFVFTAVPDSYAARTDRPENVGVLGLAVFAERQPPPQPPAVQARRKAAARDAASGALAEASPPAPAAPPAERAAENSRQELGTGHGAREYAPTRYTAFERASAEPVHGVALRYDSHERLLALGVIARPQPPRPRPFPLSFVPDPPSIR